MEAVAPLVKKRWRVGTLSMGVSTGLMEEFRYTINSKFITADLPLTQFDVPAGIDKIIIQTADRKLKIDKNSSAEIRLLGNYQMDTAAGADSTKLKAEDVAKIETIGKTMYVLIKGLPGKRGFERNLPISSMTLVVPQAIAVEVRDAYNNVITGKA
jgi:hypothetical protein